MNFIGKFLLVIIITLVGAAVSCGGNLALGAEPTNWWIFIWILEIIIIFIYSIYSINFIFSKKTPHTKEEIKKGKHTENSDIEESDLNNFSNFNGL